VEAHTSWQGADEEQAGVLSKWTVTNVDLVVD
jgi:hypothetical protein